MVGLNGALRFSTAVCNFVVATGGITAAVYEGSHSYLEAENNCEASQDCCILYLFQMNYLSKIL